MAWGLSGQHRAWPRVLTRQGREGGSFSDRHPIGNASEPLWLYGQWSRLLRARPDGMLVKPLSSAKMTRVNTKWNDYMWGFKWRQWLEAPWSSLWDRVGGFCGLPSERRAGQDMSDSTSRRLGGSP